MGRETDRRLVGTVEEKTQLALRSFSSRCKDGTFCSGLNVQSTDSEYIEYQRNFYRASAPLE